MHCHPEILEGLVSMYLDAQSLLSLGNLKPPRIPKPPWLVIKEIQEGTHDELALTHLPNLQEITLFYYLPQGWRLYQRIDTLFRRITWRLSTSGSGHRLWLTMHKQLTWHALVYRWLPRRRGGCGCPWTSCLAAPSASVPPCLPPISSTHLCYGGQPWNL